MCTLFTIHRLKNQKWAMPVTGSDGALTLQPLCYRRESRMEVIINTDGGLVCDSQAPAAVHAAVEAAAGGDWKPLEDMLLSALLQTQ